MKNSVHTFLFSIKAASISYETEEAHDSFENENNYEFRRHEFPNNIVHTK